MPANSETETDMWETNNDDPISSDAGVSSEEDDRILKDEKLKNKVATFESLPLRDHHERFLRECVEIILKDAIFKGTARENKVVEFHAPDKMLKMFDFALRDDPSTHDELKKLVKDTIHYSVKTGHPYFINQLFSAVDPYGLIGQWLTDALNPSIYTYEVTPVFTLMEEIVLRELRTIVGFPAIKGDGIFCPGGSLANGYAISMARYKYNPKIKETGLHGLPRLIVFTSEDAHYSVKKLASFLGLGSDSVCAIRTDPVGRMMVDHLKEQIEVTMKEGGVPLMVSCTSGTTVLGAFDDLEAIADICKTYNIWMHVDAAWGGGALMSKKYRYLFKGVERADSIIWNPHKLLTIPQQCSVLLLKHEGLLAAANSSNAVYLFQKDKFYDTSYDTGDKHIQCGRRVDVLKFWLMWKAKGTSGFEKHVDKVMDNAKFFLETIRNREGFRLVIEPQYVNVCFWYIPPSLRGRENETGYDERLHRVAPKIKEKMMKSGSMMMGYQPRGKLPNFFRMVLQNAALTHDDMTYFVEQIEKLGKDL